MEPRPLSLGERAEFRRTHDVGAREDYAVDLIVLCCGIPVEEAQRFWDEESLGATHDLVSRCEAELFRDTVQPACDMLADDPLMSSIMAVCEQYQIPFSTFNSWPAQDQDLAVAYYLESRDTCPGCGLAKRTRKKLIKISSEHCVHCEQIKQVRDVMPEEVRHKTHLTISAETS